MTELLTITNTDNYEQSKKITNGILSDIIKRTVRRKSHVVLISP